MTDFDDFVSRTNGARGATADTGVLDTGPLPDGPGDLDVTGTFLAACLPALIKDNPELALLFYVESKFTAGASGGGTVDLTFTPMVDTAPGGMKNGGPTKMVKAQTSGAPFGAKGVAVAADGTFSANIGSFTVPGDAQRIGDSTLQLDAIVFQSRILSKDRICSELDGKLTAPLTQDLSPPGDFCIFKRLEDGADIPTITVGGKPPAAGFEGSEYHCP